MKTTRLGFFKTIAAALLGVKVVPMLALAPKAELLGLEEIIDEKNGRWLDGAPELKQFWSAMREVGNPWDNIDIRNTVVCNDVTLGNGHVAIDSNTRLPGFESPAVEPNC